jgi:hypothetical protein
MNLCLRAICLQREELSLVVPVSHRVGDMPEKKKKPMTIVTVEHKTVTSQQQHVLGSCEISSFTMRISEVAVGNRK